MACIRWGGREMYFTMPRLQVRETFWPINPSIHMLFNNLVFFTWLYWFFEVSILYFTVNNTPMFGGFGVPSRLRIDSLWSKARKHSNEKLQPMWDQGDWSWEQLLSNRSSLFICTVTVISCTRSYSRASIRSKNWHLVFRMHSCWTLLWKCKFSISNDRIF